MEDYIPVAAGRTACSSLPESRYNQNFVHPVHTDIEPRTRRGLYGLKVTIETKGRLTLVELVQESTLYGFPTIPLDKAPQQLVVHLPAVHRFLVFHAFFGDQHVDDLWVGNGAVTFEPLADYVAEVDRRDVENVEGSYFWSLEEGLRHGIGSVRDCGMGLAGLTERYQSR